MNILHIVPSMNPKLGGVAEAIRSFEIGFTSLSFLEKGSYRAVVCFDNKDEVNDWNNQGLTIHALGQAKSSWQYQEKLVGWLTLNYTEYDVMIVHGIWLYHSYAINKFIANLKRQHQKYPKLFIMPHGMLDPWFQQDKTRRLKALRNDVYWYLIENSVINSANGLLFTCDQERDLARIPFPNYKPQNEFVVGLGIKAPPVFDQKMTDALVRKFPLLDGKPYVLFLSRVDYKKGVDLLVEAYRKILLDYANSFDMLPLLVIAGPGLDTNYGREILNSVNSDVRLASKVIFTGMITGDLKWGAIYTADAFILPSHQENFGIAVVEALACGKPVLISNQVNICQEIKSVGAGFVEEDTLEGTYKLFTSLLGLTLAEKEIMTKQAQVAYTRFFDVSVTAKKLIEVMKSN